MNSFDNELDTIRSNIWNELQCAISNRQHGWRTLTLSTLSSDGLPDARTVVLREIAPEAQRLTIYTDKRSPKVFQSIDWLSLDRKGHRRAKIENGHLTWLTP